MIHRGQRASLINAAAHFMRRLIVTRHDRKPAYETRRTGYVTQAMIDQHGSFAKALAVLNGVGG